MISFSKNLLYLFIPLITLVVWNGNETSIEIKLPLFQLLIIITSIALLLKLVRKNSVTLYKNSLSIILFLYLIFSIISYLSTNGMSQNYSTAMPHIFGVLLFFITQINFSKENINNIFKIITYVVIPVSIYGLIQFFNIDPIHWETSNERLRIISTFGHKNYLAIYLLLIIPITGFGAIFSEKNIHKIISIIASVLATTLLLVSNSRGAVVSFILMIILGWFLFIYKNYINKRDSLKTYSPYLIIPVLLLIFFIIPKSVKQDFGNLYKKSELNTRTNYWKAALEVSRRSPFSGIGPGNFPSQYPENIKHKINITNPDLQVPHVHNDFLEIYTEYGIIPFLLYLAFIIILFKQLWKYYKKSSEKKDYLSAILLIISLGSYLLYSFVTVAPRYTSSQFYFWIIAAIAVIISKDNINEDRVVFNKDFFKILSTIIIVVLLFAGYKTVTRYWASVLVKKASNELKLNRVTNAKTYLIKAKKLDNHSIVERYLSGYLDFLNDDIDSAIKKYEYIYNKNSGYINIAFNLASCYYKKGDWIHAIHWAEVSKKQYPAYLQNSDMLAYCYYNLREPAKALYNCEYSLRINSNNNAMIKLRNELRLIWGGKL